jgi:glycosyltransferase involved in cell wall biosynthesis
MTLPRRPTSQPRATRCRRIALVCDWFLPRVGGIELHLLDLAQQLRREGHHVEILTPTPGPGMVDGVPVRRLQVRRAAGLGFAISPALVGVIRQALAAMAADLVHTHISIVAPTGWAGGRAAVQLRIPCIATFHSLPTGPVPLALSLLDLLWGWRRWPVHWTAVSGLVARSFSPLLGGRGIAVLPNAVDPAEWQVPAGTPAASAMRNEALPSPARGVHLVSVMRLSPRKRPLSLVRMAARIRWELPDTPFRWTVAGDGPERGRMEALAERLGVRDLFHVRGFLPREEVRDLLAGGDVFVLPAVLESFGIAALQARAAGLPVVARREGGVGGFVRHGVDGALASSDEEMASILVEWIGQPHRLAALGGIAEIRHSWTRVLPLYGEARRIAEVLASGGGSAESGSGRDISASDREEDERVGPRPRNALQPSRSHPPPTTGTR